MLHLVKVKIGRTVQIQAFYFLYVCICPTNMILRTLPGMRDYSKFIQIVQVSVCSSFQSKYFILKEGICIYLKNY